MNALNIILKTLISCFCLCVIVTIGCDNKEMLVADKTINILKEKYPLNYPSTNPLPNEVIAVLKAGDKVAIVKKIYEKDYMAYKVRIDNKKTGYIIHSKDAFHIE